MPAGLTGCHISSSNNPGDSLWFWLTSRIIYSDYILRFCRQTSNLACVLVVYHADIHFPCWHGPSVPTSAVSAPCFRIRNLGRGQTPLTTQSYFLLGLAAHQDASRKPPALNWFRSIDISCPLLSTQESLFSLTEFFLF